MIKDAYNAQSIANEARSKYVPETKTFYHYPYADPAVHMADSKFYAWVAFFSCSETPKSICYRRDKFIGPYRDESNPIAVEKGKCDGFYAGYVEGWSAVEDPAHPRHL
jgi:cellobiose phosphorylase